MSISGAELRLSRLFQASSRRSFMIALDHGLAFGPLPGLESPETLVTTVLSASPDAVVLGPGVLAATAQHLRYRGAPSIVVRLDFVNVDERLRQGGDRHDLLCTPGEAARLGADAVIMFLVVGTDGAFGENLRTLARTTEAAHALGLPLIAEVVPWGRRSWGAPVDPDLLAIGCRIAAEAGVDAVKTVHPGTRDGWRSLVSTTPVPLLALGGARGEEPGAVLGVTKDVVEAGGAGVIYGRHIWQAPNPEAVAAQIRRIVHGSSDE